MSCVPIFRQTCCRSASRAWSDKQKLWHWTSWMSHNSFGHNLRAETPELCSASHMATHHATTAAKRKQSTQEIMTMLLSIRSERDSTWNETNSAKTNKQTNKECISKKWEAMWSLQYWLCQVILNVGLSMTLCYAKTNATTTKHLGKAMPLIYELLVCLLYIPSCDFHKWWH